MLVTTIICYFSSLKIIEIMIFYFNTIGQSTRVVTCIKHPERHLEVYSENRLHVLDFSMRRLFTCNPKEPSKMFTESVSVNPEFFNKLAKPCLESFRIMDKCMRW